MKESLNEVVKAALNEIPIDSDDFVLDIGANDGTLLSNLKNTTTNRIACEPALNLTDKLRNHCEFLLDDFWNIENLNRIMNRNMENQVKIIFAIGMFYDLEDPCQFAKEVNAILDPQEGIWVLEQSYMPEMVRVNSFDTVCHEHLSYYGMRQIKYIMDQAGFKIINFEFNDVNGGSISVVVAPISSYYEECVEKLHEILLVESKNQFHTIKPWEDFSERIDVCRTEFFRLIDEFKKQGLKIAGLGSSTKGNVILQS
jgi:hypothetical protein